MLKQLLVWFDVMTNNLALLLNDSLTDQSSSAALSPRSARDDDAQSQTGSRILARCTLAHMTKSPMPIKRAKCRWVIGTFTKYMFVYFMYVTLFSQSVLDVSVDNRVSLSFSQILFRKAAFMTTHRSCTLEKRMIDLKPACTYILTVSVTRRHTCFVFAMVA